MFVTASLLSLAFAQPAAAAVPPAVPVAVQEEILVVGEKLKTWRGRITPAGAALRCVTTKPTGDAEIDQIGCAAMVGCFAPMRPRMDAAGDRRRPAAERRALLAAVERELGPCMIERRDDLIAALAERRHQAREGTLNAQN